ncbi:MAG: alcohol dehydrogenase catalytic domain-containing protein [Pirellulales bacterium]|nr:alcohol dehydrogenase catalytic domain-containing protein [Pirellulales bacterium]
MKIAQFTSLGKIEIVDASKPVISRAEEVLLRIERLGVCGSDVHYFREGRIGDQILEYPAALGHECAGTVAEVGGAVKTLEPGDRVAIDPAISCGRCDQCLAGRENTCRNLRFMGNPGEAPGAAAEFAVLPARNCFSIPDSMSLETAVLVEPLSVGLHAVRLSEMRDKSNIGILGAGPIGLGVLLCAKAMIRSCTIYMTDLLAERLEMAARCGADWTGFARGGDIDIATTIHREEPLGLDAVFECSGDPAAIDEGLRLLAPGGTLVLVGIPPADRVNFDIHHARRRELTLKNVRRQNGCFAPVIEMIESGRLDPRPLLTHRFPLAKIAEAFELVEGYRDGVIKAIIEIGGDRGQDTGDRI